MRHEDLKETNRRVSGAGILVAHHNHGRIVRSRHHALGARAAGSAESAGVLPAVDVAGHADALRLLLGHDADSFSVPVADTEPYVRLAGIRCVAAFGGSPATHSIPGRHADRFRERGTGLRPMPNRRFAGCIQGHVLPTRLKPLARRRRPHRRASPRGTAQGIPSRIARMTRTSRARSDPDRRRTPSIRSPDQTQC